MVELKIWFDTFNWIVARSAEDASKVYEDHVGQRWEGGDADEEFVLWDDEYTMLYEVDQSKGGLPDGATAGRHEGPHPYPWFVKASAQAWVDHAGRGFLGCVDF